MNISVSFMKCPLPSRLIDTCGIWGAFVHTGPHGTFINVILTQCSLKTIQTCTLVGADTLTSIFTAGFTYSWNNKRQNKEFILMHDSTTRGAMKPKFDSFAFLIQPFFVGLLIKKRITIWYNSSFLKSKKTFLLQKGLSYIEGDLNPIPYGLFLNSFPMGVGHGCALQIQSSKMAFFC